MSAVPWEVQSPKPSTKPGELQIVLILFLSGTLGTVLAFVLGAAAWVLVIFMLLACVGATLIFMERWSRARALRHEVQLRRTRGYEATK